MVRETLTIFYSAMEEKLKVTKWLLFGLYFVQKTTNHLGGISKLVLRKFFKASHEQGGLGLNPAQAGFIITTTSIGWYLKPLLGIITDNVPLFGYRRKYWIVFALLFSGTTWLYIAFFNDFSKATIIACLVTINILVAFTDVVTDGFFIDTIQDGTEKEKIEQNKLLQSYQWRGAFTAVILSSFFGGIIAQAFNLKLAALISGTIPIIMAVVVCWKFKEQRVNHVKQEKRKGFIAMLYIAVFVTLIVFINKITLSNIQSTFVAFGISLLIMFVVLGTTRFPKQLLMPVIILFLWEAIPFDKNSQYFYSYISQDNKEIGNVIASNQFVAFVSDIFNSSDNASGRLDFFYSSILLTIGQTFSLVGCLIYFSLFRKLNYLKGFKICILLYLIEMFLFATIPVFHFTSVLLLICCSALSGVVFAFALLISSTYSAELVPNSNQAAIFAALASASNMGKMLGVEIVGNNTYTYFANGSMGNPNNGLIAVLLFSILFLIFLFAIIKNPL